MSSKIIRAKLFCFEVNKPLKGGNIETLCTQDIEAFKLYNELNKLYSLKVLNFNEMERKKEIINILQEKIHAMIIKRENNKGEKKELNEGQLSLF